MRRRSVKVNNIVFYFNSWDYLIR